MGVNQQLKEMRGLKKTDEMSLPSLIYRSGFSLIVFMQIKCLKNARFICDTIDMVTKIAEPGQEWEEASVSYTSSFC